MIFHLLPDAAAPFVLIAGLACPAAPAPVITVDFQNMPAHYKSDLSSAELGNFKIDTTFSHGANEIFKVGGLTQSQVKTSYKMKTLAQSNPQTHQSCVWIESINIEVSYSPIVYIASEYKQGSCRYNITAQHELRHVNTDIITLNEHIKDLQAAVAAVASTLKVHEPFATNDIEKVRAYFTQKIEHTVQAQSDAMERRRAQRQQLIDTRQEYLRLSKECPGEPNLLR